MDTKINTEENTNQLRESAVYCYQEDYNTNLFK